MFLFYFVVFLAKNLGLNSRVSFLSSLMYLMLFAHFHAYMWPMAFQHLIVVFILSGLILYLKTNNLFFPTEISWLFFSDFIGSVIIVFLPAKYINIARDDNDAYFGLFKDRKDMLRKYDIWLPLFLFTSFILC